MQLQTDQAHDEDPTERIKAAPNHLPKAID